MDSLKPVVSRRKFVEIFGAVSAMGATSMFVSGCGSTSSGSATDTITFGQGSDPRGLDPAYVDDGESAKVMWNIYETLLKYGKSSCDDRPRPCQGATRSPMTA